MFKDWPKLHRRVFIGSLCAFVAILPPFSMWVTFPFINWLIFSGLPLLGLLCIAFWPDLPLALLRGIDRLRGIRPSASHTERPE